MENFPILSWQHFKIFLHQGINIMQKAGQATGESGIMSVWFYFSLQMKGRIYLDRFPNTNRVEQCIGMRDVT